MCDCLFCKIIKKEIPSFKIYEDEETYAFLDISKDVNYHTLLVPKKHVDNILDCDSNTLNNLMKACKKISNHYVDDLKFDGVNIFNNSGASAGQSIMHFHLHIIPRKENDGIDANPKFNGASVELEDACKFLKYEK